MPVVNLPDGTPVNFPDSMSPDDIQAAMNENQSQMQGPWRWPAELGSAALKGATEGLAGAAGAMTAPLTNLVNTATGYLAPHLVGDDPQAQQQLQQQVKQLTDPSYLPIAAERKAGLIDRPDLVPQNAGERYATAGTEGAASMLPTLFAPGSWGARAQALAQGVGGGLGGQAASDLTQGGPDWLRKYAPVVGNVIGSLGAGGAYNVANKVAGNVAGTSTPVLDAYDRLNIPTTRMGDVGGGPFARFLQSTTGELGGGFSVAQRAAKATVGAWNTALQKTADMLGTSKTAQQAGEQMQAQGNNWLDAFKQNSKTNWNNVEMQVGNTTPTPTPNYQATLDQIRTDIPTASATRDVLEPDLNRDLLTALTTDTRVPPRNTGLLDAQGNPIVTPAQSKPLTWADVNGIRKQIGQRLADPTTYDDPANAQLKQLYAALSSDQEALVGTKGQAAQDAFNTARDYSSNGHQFIENVLSKIVKGNAITPEQATRNMLGSSGAGGTTLQALRAEMPQAADELASYKLRDMGLASAGKQTEPDLNRPSPSSFMTDSANLSPEASGALFGDRWVAPRVADLRTVAGTMKETEQDFSNPSKTGRFTKGAEALSLLPAMEAFRAGHEAGGLPLAFGATAATLAAPWLPGTIGSRLMNSPALTRFFAHPGLLGSQPASGPAAFGAYSQYPPSLLQ